MKFRTTLAAIFTAQLSILALPTYGEECDSNFSFDKPKHSYVPMDFGRHTIEKFLKKNLGADLWQNLLKGETRIKLLISHGEENEWEISDAFYDLKLRSHMEDNGREHTDFVTFANARDLVNLIRKLCPTAYEFKMSFNPQNKTLVMDLEPAFDPAK